MQTEQIVLTARPTGTPTTDDFRTETIELPDLQEGEVLLKAVYYSVDPYMRGRMNDTKSYVPPFEIGQPLAGMAIAKVIASKAPELEINDMVAGSMPWRVQTNLPAKGLQKIDVSIAPASYYLGILGMTGLTAYFGLLDIGKPKDGETVVISGAAGAVGTIAGQIAKIKGCHVIGITGSDAKVTLLKEEFGFDNAINYKTVVDMNSAIATLCPHSVDVYFDNVGGEISDAVISNINFNARIILCGQISLYNNNEMPVGPRLQPMLLTRSVLMQGFIISNYQSRFAEGIRQLSQWLTEGKLKCTETIIHGFEQLPNAFMGLFKGENTGKMIVEV